MAQCWWSHDIRKWMKQGAILLIPSGDAIIWLRPVALLEGSKKREI